MSDLAAPHILALTAYEPGKPEDELRRELRIDVGAGRNEIRGEW